MSPLHRKNFDKSANSQLKEGNKSFCHCQARVGIFRTLTKLRSLSRQGCIIITVITVFYITFWQVRQPLILQSELSSSISMQRVLLFSFCNFLLSELAITATGPPASYPVFLISKNILHKRNILSTAGQQQPTVSKYKWQELMKMPVRMGQFFCDC